MKNKPKKKRFRLDAILSVTTGRLVTLGDENTNGIDDMYKLMSWIMGSVINDTGACENHDTCTEFLINQFHELALANDHLDELSKMLKATPAKGHGLALIAWFQLVMKAHPKIKWEYMIPQHGKTV